MVVLPEIIDNNSESNLPAPHVPFEEEGDTQAQM